MSSEGLPGSFQQEDDESYQRSRRMSPSPVRHLRSHSEVVAGSSRLTSHLDAPEYKGVQPQRNSPLSPAAPGHTNVQGAVKYTM
jgi:hypothetical protein